ncbi:ABC transporter ATP-binding protein [Suttonella sp. R2A3]|uniref:ABC transporter ATP-binding protein n=1 Tax=Suttonella sp. R2A3 TaxID=2908648 RepID=UPI001F244D25|nr:ABC transporter ATP-binding protein [Suttonella sp. R2A3]UJF24850.1 ABC transporter ATP-binding protein [Suttonella sp. R2A3]
MSEQPLALEISQLTKTYRNGFRAVKGIDLRVEQGDFYALLGPNGAGKSTTISMLTSLTRKTSGSIRIFGHDIDQDFSRAKKKIGLVPQEFNLNVFERAVDVVRNQAGFYNLAPEVALERAEYYLDKLGLTDKKNSQVRELSGGMKRRLMIARAMAHEPSLLILDEPTAGVDIEIRRSMWQFLQQINAEGTTIILTTHYLEEAEQLCRRIGVINHGEMVYEGAMGQLLSQMDEETFVLNIEPQTLDPRVFSDFSLRQIDLETIEVRVHRANQTINTLIERLSAHNVRVHSMRNKVNRLEELFMRLVN